VPELRVAATQTSFAGALMSTSRPTLDHCQGAPPRALPPTARHSGKRAGHTTMPTN
jgi:hypothetical protein